MQFGVQFFPAVDHTDKSAADYYTESLALVQEAESLGFTHARTVEHYFTRYGGYSPNPIVFLTAMSQRTKAMRLVTGAVLPVFNHPFKLAGEIAMLDGISGGRLDVGFARAFLPHEFRRFGISPDESQARFREGLEQIELLLTRENATHHGQFHSFDNVTSLPRPTQRPRPKFYIAATQTPESFEYAGSKGYSLMAIPIGPLGPLLERYRKAWRAAGHAGNGEVMVAFHMFCHEDARRARDIARPPFEEYFRALNEAVGDWARGTTSKDYRDYDTSMRRLRSFTLDGQIESGGAWVGTPAEIKAIIARTAGTIGKFEHASLQINFGTLDFAAAQASMRLFATEVMPEFAAPVRAFRSDHPKPLAAATQSSDLAMTSGIRECLPPVRNPRKPNVALPRGSVDTHVHVFEQGYPLSPGRGYNPPISSLSDLEHLHATLGIDRVVFTQPSVYGTDNSAILDAMAALNTRTPNRARSVVAIAMDISDDELARLDASGVRGVRLNTDNKGGMPIELRDVPDLAARIRPFGWHIEFLFPGKDILDLRAGLQRARGADVDRALRLSAGGRRGGGARLSGIARACSRGQYLDQDFRRQPGQRDRSAPL